MKFDTVKKALEILRENGLIEGGKGTRRVRRLSGETPVMRVQIPSSGIFIPSSGTKFQAVEFGEGSNSKQWNEIPSSGTICAPKFQAVEFSLRKESGT